MYKLFNPYSECVFIWCVYIFLQCTWNGFIMLLAWLPCVRDLYSRISLIIVGGIGWARATGWYGQGMEYYAGRQHVYGGFLHPTGTVKLSCVVNDTKSIQIVFLLKQSFHNTCSQILCQITRCKNDKRKAVIYLFSNLLNIQKTCWHPYPDIYPQTSHL